MKKMLTSGLVLVAMFATANVFADDPNAGKVTTKSYVDAGLDYLYQTKQDKITAQNPLSSDLVDDTNHTNKFVTASEKSQITTNATNIGTLQTTINGDGTTTFGLAGDVANLKDAVNGDGTKPGLAEIVNGNGTTTTGLVGAVGTAGDGTVGSGSGLTGRVEDLELQMQNVPSALTGVNGVTISGGNAQVTGLSAATASDDKTYVFINNTATELPVVDTWTNPWVTP